MYAAQHADFCYKRFGKTFIEIHDFLDQYYKFFGQAHRIIFHHRLGVQLIVKKFGEEAREPTEIHIRQDLEGEFPDDWSFVGEPLLLKVEDYDHMESLLKEHYGDDVYKEIQNKLES